MKYILFLFILYHFPTYAQQKSDFKKPDYKYIEHATLDPSSAVYYPTLFTRYQANDTTLTHMDFYMLYYGYFFQKNKTNESAVNYADSIKYLYTKNVLSADDKQTLLNYLKKGLKANPYRLSYLNMLSRLYSDLGDKLNQAAYKYKFDMIVDDILDTGDGVSEENAMHILAVEDEYAVLTAIGFKFNGHQTLTKDKCDYLEVQENKFGIKGLYFDAKQIFKGYANTLKDVPVKQK